MHLGAHWRGHFQIKACDCGTVGEAGIGEPPCSANARVDSEMWAGGSPCKRTRGPLWPPALSPSLWELETLPEDPGQYPWERDRQELRGCQSPGSTSWILLSVRVGMSGCRGSPRIWRHPITQLMETSGFQGLEGGSEGSEVFF